MALLGKISAVLTANTQDFTRRIGESRRELQDFARQARGIQFNLNTRALDGTLTQLQRFQRTLREIQQLQSRGIDAGLPNVGRLRDQFRAFEDIGRPLTALKNQIEGLSSSIQAELYPELEKIQAGFRNFYRDLDTGAAAFDRSAARVDNLQRRLQALSRVTAAVRDVGGLARTLDADNTGASFFQGRARESLQRTISLRGQAQNIPAALRGDVFADLSAQAEENAQRIEQAVARVARAQLRIANGGSGGGPTSRNIEARGRAQAELDSLTRRQNAINLSFQREMESAAIQQIVSPGAERQVASLRERLGSLATELRAINGQQFNGLIAGAAAVVEQFNRGTASAREAKQAVDALAASLNAANTSRGLQQQTESLLFTPREASRRRIQSDYDRQVAGLAPDDPQRRGAGIQRSVNLYREQLNADGIPRAMEAATAARSLGTADGVRDAERLLEIQRQINAELRRSANLNQNRQYDQAQERLRRVQLLLQEQVFVEGRITDQVEIRNAARRQEELFLESSGGRAEQLSQGARDAAANVSVARQFRGQIASGAARIQISAEIDRVTNSIIELQRQMARVAASDLGFDERVAELDRLDNEIRQSTNGLAAFVADRSGGAFNTRQIEASMGRARNQSGSLSGTGVLTAQLAAQQALFAIDDFISSTGGFEYKIRAIGNNITQLGLLLGQSGLIAGLTATTGLFAGLAVVIGGQALSAIIKWYNAGVTAEDQAKALNDALQKQKSLAEELAASFESLGKSIADGAFSASAKSARDFALSLEEVAKKQQLLREEQFGALDPASVQQKSIATSIDKRLQAATDAGQIVALTQAQTRARVAARGAARTAAGRSPNFDDAISAVGAGTQNRAESNRRLLGAQLDYWGGGISSLFNGLGFAARLAGRANAPMPESQDLRRQRLEAARGDRVAERNAVQTEIDRLRPLAEQDIGLFTTLTGTSEAVANASREFSRLQLVLIALNESASQDDISRFFRSAREGGLALEAAQNQAAEAIRAGIPSALALSGYIDRLAGEIDAAQKEIAKAQQEFAQRGSAPTQADFDELNRQVSAAQARIDRGRAAREQAQARAAELEQRRIVDPQSTLDARRQRAEANLQASGAESGIIARRIRELEARRARAEAAVSQRPDSAFVRRRADREISAINEEMKAIEAATLGLKRFTEALARASAEAESNLQAARQRDDDIRRQSLAPGRGAALPTQAERDRARRNVEEQQVANRAVEQAVAQERDRLERLAQDPQNPLSETFRRLREIDEQLSSGAGTERERQRLIEERRSLQQRVDSQIDESPAVRAARDNSTRIEQRQTAEDRGRDLAMTPAQRAAREFGQQARDLTAEMNRINAPNAVRGANMSRLALEAAQQVAPMVMGFREERLNAALQGPSRAALNVADVNTMEGQRELNRLLRGDDANRDVNLVELQKQTEKLQEVVDAIRDQDRAAVVELRG